SADALTERERRVLEAVIHTYIETAEPAGSQTIARRYPLGLSSASIRSIMSDLEAKGFLYHTHTSAGRIPTDQAYRRYVNDLTRFASPSDHERETIRRELGPDRNAIEEILRRAAQVLGVLTHELGVAAAPRLDAVVLERLDLVHVASERLLLVFHLRSGAVRTIFVQIPASVAAATVEHVTRILNERLAGLTLRDIRASLGERLRDVDGLAQGGELLNIFLAEGDEIFDLSVPPEGVVLGSAELLAGQPEFASNEKMRGLLSLTGRRDVLREALDTRQHAGLSITIGSEHDDARLADFTLVTSSYRLGDLTGVIGVIGPTRMPYDKIIGLVQHTSRLVEGLIT
ncbi:MAG TPA: heat-inducible transcriptional repressor HrcA, partial [Gemmatimonadales bacterium]